MLMNWIKYELIWVECFIRLSDIPTFGIVVKCYNNISNLTTAGHFWFDLLRRPGNSHLDLSRDSSSSYGHFYFFVAVIILDELRNGQRNASQEDLVILACTLGVPDFNGHSRFRYKQVLARVGAHRIPFWLFRRSDQVWNATHTAGSVLDRQLLIQVDHGY